MYKIKRMTALLLTISMLLTGTVVFADDTTANGLKARITEKAKDLKAFAAEAKPLLETVRKNRTELLQLRAEARTACEAAKNRVKELLENGGELSPEQLQQLKQASEILKNDKKLISDTLGDIGTESLKLRAARRERDTEAYNDALNSIIEIQNTRIETLKKAISDMNTIIEI